MAYRHPILVHVLSAKLESRRLIPESKRGHTLHSCSPEPSATIYHVSNRSVAHIHSQIGREIGFVTNEIDAIKSEHAQLLMSENFAQNS